MSRWRQRLHITIQVKVQVCYSDLSSRLVVTLCSRSSRHPEDSYKFSDEGHVALYILYEASVLGKRTDNQRNLRLGECSAGSNDEHSQNSTYQRKQTTGDNEWTQCWRPHTCLVGSARVTLSPNDPHSRASVAKQYNLLVDRGRWSAAGKVAVGLASRSQDVQKGDEDVAVACTLVLRARCTVADSLDVVVTLTLRHLDGETACVCVDVCVRSPQRPTRTHAFSPQCTFPTMYRWYV